MSIQEARRMAFEKSFPLTDGVYWNEEKQGYSGGKIWWLYDARLQAWNAALDSVVVSLPGSVGYEHVYDEVDMKTLEPEDDRYADESFALVRAIEVQEAIEAAGIRVEVKS